MSDQVCPGVHPRLWISAEELPKLRQKASSGTPQKILEAALKIANRPFTEFSRRTNFSSPDLQDVQALRLHTTAAAISYLLTEDKKYAEFARENILAMIREYAPSDLGRASQALTVTIAYDWCYNGWDQKTRDTVGRWLVGVSLSFKEIGNSNPDNPFNNWWAVTHSAEGLSAMAVHGDYTGAEQQIDIAREKVRSYLSNFGDRGYCYEGTGYGGYTVCFWAPFALASLRLDNVDLLDLAPGLKYLPSTTYAMTAFRRKQSDEIPPNPVVEKEIGVRIFWNDDGGNLSNSGDSNLLFALAPKEHLPALRWMYDRLCGELGDGTFAPGFCGWVWALLYYPSDVPPQDPNSILPNTVLDNRMGLAIFRNRYQDQNDCILGVYAKAYHGGGHAQDDAGSFRFMGLNASWSKGGGQAKWQQQYQSVLIRKRIDGSDEPSNFKLGKIIYVAPEKNGSGAVSMRLNRMYEARFVDRHVSIKYLPHSEFPAVIGMADCILDTEASIWQWTMCYESTLQVRLEPDQNGFTLAGHDNGAKLMVRFASPQNLTFADHEGVASRRTFATSNQTKVYGGAKHVSATSLPCKEVNFFCTMMLFKGDAPRLEISGNDLDAVFKTRWTTTSFQRGHWFHGPVRIHAED